MIILLNWYRLLLNLNLVEDGRRDLVGIYNVILTLKGHLAVIFYDIFYVVRWDISVCYR